MPTVFIDIHNDFKQAAEPLNPFQLLIWLIWHHPVFIETSWKEQGIALFKPLKYLMAIFISEKGSFHTLP